MHRSHHAALKIMPLSHLASIQDLSIVDRQLLHMGHHFMHTRGRIVRAGFSRLPRCPSAMPHGLRQFRGKFVEVQPVLPVLRHMPAKFLDYAVTSGFLPRPAVRLGSEREVKQQPILETGHRRNRPENSRGRRVADTVQSLLVCSVAVLVENAEYAIVRVSTEIASLKVVLLSGPFIDIHRTRSPGPVEMYANSSAKKPIQLLKVAALRFCSLADNQYRPGKILCRATPAEIVAG